jgi:hypothetical protein
MKRRDFMVQSIGASLLAYLTGSGAAAAPAGSEKQTPERLSALNPVSQYVKRYVRPEGVLDTSQRQSLTFDILGWRTDKGRQIVSTPVLGTITVKRSPLDGAVEYEVEQNHGRSERMTGRFRCLADRRHSLQRWQFEYVLDSKRRNIANMSRTEQSGRREGDKIVVVTDGAETVLKCSAPLLCRWGLLDAACRMAELCQTHDRYTVLHEPTGLRPDQRFREDRSGVLDDGKDAPIRTFLQTGPATVPTHWIVDSQGRPLFVSAFLISLALKAIS